MLLLRILNGHHWRLSTLLSWASLDTVSVDTLLAIVCAGFHHRTALSSVKFERISLWEYLLSMDILYLWLGCLHNILVLFSAQRDVRWRFHLEFTSPNSPFLEGFLILELVFLFLQLDIHDSICLERLKSVNHGVLVTLAHHHGIELSESLRPKYLAVSNSIDTSWLIEAQISASVSKDLISAPINHRSVVSLSGGGRWNSHDVWVVAFVVLELLTSLATR